MSSKLSIASSSFSSQKKIGGLISDIQKKSQQSRVAPTPSSSSSVAPVAGANVASIMTDIKRLMDQLPKTTDLDTVIHYAQFCKQRIYQHQEQSIPNEYRVGDYIVFVCSAFKNHPFVGVVQKLNKKTIRLVNLAPVLEHEDDSKCAVGPTPSFSIHPCYVKRKVTKQQFETYQARKRDWFPDCFDPHPFDI
jgi:hypothetical protein